MRVFCSFSLTRHHPENPVIFHRNPPSKSCTPADVGNKIMVTKRRLPMSSAARSLTPFPLCPICSLPVIIEKCKTDENGKAVHEECYVLKIRATLKKPPTNS